MSIIEAKKALDLVIKKGRVHLYKPIQIAEILYRDRVEGDIELSDLSTYRTKSKKWRDVVCEEFLGRSTSSSSKYQDDIFNAVPPELIALLGEENRKKEGIVEAYIYRKFVSRFTQMSNGLDYAFNSRKEDFELDKFLDLFWREPGLRRSIDKIYEIVVYALFSSLVDALDISVNVNINPDRLDILHEFEEFAKSIILISPERRTFTTKARINRVGVTNAADRGLDMWANFGPAIQIKHLSLTEELAENISTSVTADRIVIICKKAEQKLIVSLLTQIGWKAKIQSIVTENNLLEWYEKSLRGKYSNIIGDNVLTYLRDEIQLEFPVTANKGFLDFMKHRVYNELHDSAW